MIFTINILDVLVFGLLAVYAILKLFLWMIKDENKTKDDK